MMLKLVPFLLMIIITVKVIKSELVPNANIQVNKCCEPNELYVGKSCTRKEEANETVWHPVFTNEHGKMNLQVNYRLVHGSPDCVSKQPSFIYHYQGSKERLILLPNGILRHYFDHDIPGEDDELEVEIIDGKNTFYHDYEPGKYCLDKQIEENNVRELAWVCAPDYGKDWTNTEFLMRNILNPITHVIAIICLLTVAIIYFIMPTLRDLVGNIITTICVCLIISQTADLIRLLTVFDSHISFIITELICYVSLLGAFFWLNSLGYYIWKTFKSRNVFLRITDGKKYCYYSAYSWSCTIILGTLAIFAHFTMDYDQNTTVVKFNEKEQIGSLGIVIFFVPIASVIIINIIYFTSTLQTINRMHTYGRIHHKLRHSFRMFLLLLIIMTITWIFFLMSFFKFDGFINCYIVINAFQAPLILYVCIFNQKHVSYLIKKTCCYKNCFCQCCRPEPECEWGDEMTAMNTGIY